LNYIVVTLFVVSTKALVYWASDSSLTAQLVGRGS